MSRKRRQSPPAPGDGRRGTGSRAGARLDDPRYRRILQLLDLARLGRGWTRGRLEAALGRGKGYLKRVSDGPGELRVTDLLRAVDVLDLAPSEIFGPLVLGEDPGRLRPAAAPGQPQRATVAQPAEQIATLQEIEALVERLVEQRLATQLLAALEAAAERAPGAENASSA